jgi:hypothetical protein
MREAEKRQFKGFTHSNKLANDEPDWGSIDQSALPRAAFAHQGDPGDKGTWRYPHHWVQGGDSKDHYGTYKNDRMYLHQEGLNVAWEMAQLEDGEEGISQQIIKHLKAHRRALGLEKKSAKRKSPPAGYRGRVFFLFDADATAEEIVASVKRHLKP